MFRILSIAVAMGLAFINFAHAQVAAPLLTPGTATVVFGQPGAALDPSYVPTNPSVMSWNMGSVIGVGQANADREPPAPADTVPFKTTYGGFRWTGESLAVALETINFESEDPNFDFTYQSTDGGISGKLADWFSLGGGVGSAKSEQSNFSEDLTRWTVGGSARLGEWFYLGAVMGRESLDHKQTGADYEDERSLTAYGLGLYTGGKGKGGAGGGAVWHLEYSLVDAGDYTDNVGTKAGGSEVSTGTLEVLWKWIVLSYSAFSAKAKTGDGTLEGSSIEAGIAMEKSFFITARLENHEEKDGNTDIAETSTMSINLGLQF